MSPTRQDVLAGDFSADTFEAARRELMSVVEQRDALAAMLDDLRVKAALAQAAIDDGDKYIAGLLAQGLIARLLAEPGAKARMQ